MLTASHYDTEPPRTMLVQSAGSSRDHHEDERGKADPEPDLESSERAIDGLDYGGADLDFVVGFHGVLLVS